MFSTPLKKSKNKSQVEGLKENHALFARCAILLNSNRGMDMEEVISNYELGYPQSLISLSGDVYPGWEGKSKLIHTIMENTMLPLEEDILNNLLTALLSEIISHDLGIHKRHRIAIIDAMVEVQKTTPKPTWVNTCEDLAKYFISRIVNLTNKYDKVKVVFDKYEEDSLKKATRISRSAVISPVPYIVDDQTNITNISV